MTPSSVIEASDSLIVVGCKLKEIATKRFQLFHGDRPIIHIEALPEEIGRTTRTDYPLLGDARLALEDLNEALAGESRGAMAIRAGYIAEVLSRMAKWREEAKDRLEATERPINMGRMLNELNKEMPAESVLVVDGGFAAHWGGLLYDTKKAGRRFVADRGFASIGYGLPGAMGAQLAVPDQPVIGITGDGGFNMVLGELETARRAKTPFTLMIVNNAASGYIKALQHAMYGKYQSSDLIEMNCAEIAKDFGCQGIRVEDPEDLAPAIRAANEERSIPSIIDVVVTRDPAKMLPGVDNRTLKITKGDRPVRACPLHSHKWEETMRNLISTLTIAGGLSLAALSGALAADPLEVPVATWGSPSHINVATFVGKLTEVLEAETDGRISVRHYPCGQLAEDADMPVSLTSGAVKFGWVTLNNWSGLVQDVKIADAPAGLTMQQLAEAINRRIGQSAPCAVSKTRKRRTACAANALQVSRSGSGRAPWMRRICRSPTSRAMKHSAASP